MTTLRTQRPATRGRRDRALFVSGGFTLMELVVVLCIMGVVAAIAASRYGAAIARQRVDGTANRIASDIRYARALARMTSSSVSIVFDPNHDRYAIPGAPDPITNGPAPYSVDLSLAPYRANLVGAAGGSPGGAIPAVGATGSMTAFSFDGYGEPTSVGWLLVNSGPWWRMVSVDAAGRASVTRVTDSQAKGMLP